MRLLLKLILAIGLLSIVANASMLNQSPFSADQLDKEISEIHAELYRRETVKSTMKELKDAPNLQASDFACTGGVDPSKLSSQDYLKAFAKGPCTPVVVLGGITGTKLQVQIDCPTLRANNPNLFEQCRWTSCSGSSTNIIGTTPKSEYTIWIPDITAPFSVADRRNKSKECFAGLLGLSWYQEASAMKLKQNPGVRILPYGMTTESITSSKCGFDSISLIWASVQTVLSEKYKIFNALRIGLEAKGYRLGLTATAIPYDWRIQISQNGVATRMIKVIEAMKSITGKKVSIVAHSMGNMNTLNMLMKLPQEKKDSLIQRYFALAPPFTGTPRPFTIFLGTTDFTFTFLGINFWGFKNMVSTFSAFFDLMPRTFWSKFDNAPWMKSIKSRIRTEMGLIPDLNLSTQDDTVSRYFPKSDAKCQTHDWTDKTAYCNTGLFDMKSFGRILDDPITVDNMKYILSKYSYDKFAANHLQGDGKRGEFDEMPNPGVETVIMFGNMINTEKEYNYDFDPLPKTLPDDAEFVKPSSVKYAIGDGTVPTASAIAPGIKWAWEFDNKVVPGAKPIIFAEICSNQNLLGNVYQDLRSKSVTRNTYQGVACQCQKGTEKDCNHSALVSDPGTTSFIINSLMDNQSAASPRLFDTSSSFEIDDFAKRCALVTDYI
jgi:Lecithin:cholesterol acyltransferase